MDELEISTRTAMVAECEGWDPEKPQVIYY